MSAVEDLKQRLGIIADLNATAAVLGWDQETYMPPGAIAVSYTHLTLPTILLV